ncbi:SRPBCC family protein [Janibacter cremeus]|uniref:SRPBCC family protein n=1 Tax=Janibacter cremeus TaxID=1285192 RepID=A0A852VNB9_9MICO|nr:SRPBCC family protein [Janibacter cremeus]NYF98502.1 hypothetical protein [Janibacter cremeus]
MRSRGEGGAASADFVVRVDTPLTPGQAWERVWDLDRHTEVIPLTTVTLQPPATRLALDAHFCGRTAVGPVGFDDPMRVVLWEPPTTGSGRAVVAKAGSVIGGRIEVTFVPVAGRGTRITWHQHVELPWLPSPLSWLERPAARLTALGYRMVLGRLLV